MKTAITKSEYAILTALDAADGKSLSFLDLRKMSGIPTTRGFRNVLHRMIAGGVACRSASATARQVSPEQRLAMEILTELTRARAKFPGENVTFAALVEEVGELATATFAEPRANVRKEAVQVAVMAMRMVLDGDCTFDDWREKQGLDPLIAHSSTGQVA